MLFVILDLVILDSVSFPYSERKWRGLITKIIHLSHQSGDTSSFWKFMEVAEHMGEEVLESVSPEFGFLLLIHDN